MSEKKSRGLFVFQSWQVKERKKQSGLGFWLKKESVPRVKGRSDPSVFEQRKERI